MRIVIQRVKRASVSVEEKVVGSIQKGFLVLIGVGQGDDEATADKYMKKLLGLRIFEDENGKTNKSLADVDGQLLMVSQFTLYADVNMAIGLVFQKLLSRKLPRLYMTVSTKNCVKPACMLKPVVLALI